MKRIVYIILALFLIFSTIQVQSAQTVTRREVKTVASDGFNVRSILAYPKVKGKKEFSTVILLHSLGYNSQWWGDLPNLLLDKGYAVLMIDFRGHGGSIYNSKLARVSWQNIKNSGFQKLPDDILKVIDTVKTENAKRVFFNNFAIVGSDIGASAGVIAADKAKIKPKTIVMLSPVVSTKGLDIPVNIAQLDGVDFLTIGGTGDSVSAHAQDYLSKFAQNKFVIYTSESKTTGMLLLKNDTRLPYMIADWVAHYLN